MKRLGVILIMIIVLSLPLVSYGNTLSAFGPATVDGVMSPGEWDKAAKIDFLVNVPPSYGGGTVPATFYVMNDGTNIYLAVKFAQSSFGISTQFNVDFDNNNNGTANDGEDVIALYITPPSPPAFVDLYRFTSTDPSVPPFVEDPDTNSGIPPEGKKDGAGNASNDGSLTVIEMSHPLKSGDALHDISLNPGSTVWLRATLRLVGSKDFKVFTDTVLPAAGSGSNYEQVKIAPRVMQADIDIKPGSRVNSINRGSEGKIPVAILSASDFNAPARVDRSSLTFGRTGDEKSLEFCNAGSEDVNGDGLPDLVCHFTSKLTEFQQGDDSGILNGRTTDETIFTAKDTVRIVH